MNIQPLRDIVLIKADKPPQKSKAGILLREEWKSLPPYGEVMAVGPDVQTVQVGDRVMFGRYGSVILEDDLRLVPEGHIHARV